MITSIFDCLQYKMEAKIVFANSTFTLPENILSKSLLLTNLADDNLLTEPIVYPYPIDETEINCLMDYLIKEEISPNWNRCNYHQIHQFVEFFQLTDAKEFYHAYYQQIDDGSLPKLQTILRCQRMTHDIFLRPIPPSLDVTDIRIKIGSEICFWDTMVPPSGDHLIKLHPLLHYPPYIES